MNGSRDLCSKFSARLEEVPGVDIWLAPPFVYVHTLACDTRLRGFVSVGAQNVHGDVQGAFTGEVAATMVGDTGATFAIVGHSERRTIYRENDTIVDRKLKSCLDANLISVLCVGESLEQRQEGSAQTVVQHQLQALKNLLETIQIAEVVVAYEPIWAIGTGISASPVDAEEMHGKIREYLGSERSDLRILYGGSVNPKNAEELINQPNIDGFLVGGASLDPGSFNSICQIVGRS